MNDLELIFLSFFSGVRSITFNTVATTNRLSLDTHSMRMEKMSSSPRNTNETKLDKMHDDVLYHIMSFLDRYPHCSGSVAPRKLIFRKEGNDILSLALTCTGLLQSVRAYLGIQIENIDVVFPLTYHLPAMTIAEANLHALANIEESSNKMVEVNETDINSNTILKVNNPILFIFGEQVESIRLSRFVSPDICNIPGTFVGVRELHLNDGGGLDVGKFSPVRFPLLSDLSVGNPSKTFLKSLPHWFPNSSIKILSLHNVVISLLPLLLKSFQSASTNVHELNVLHIMPYPSSRSMKPLFDPCLSVPEYIQISNFIHALLMYNNNFKKIRISAIHSMAADIGKCTQLISEYLDKASQEFRDKYFDVLQIQVPHIRDALPEPFMKFANVDILNLFDVPSNRMIWDTLACTLSVPYNDSVMSTVEANQYMDKLKESSNNHEIYRLVLTDDNPFTISMAPKFEFLAKYVIPVLKNDITIHIPYDIICFENRLDLIQFVETPCSENVRAFMIVMPPRNSLEDRQINRHIHVSALLKNLVDFLKAVFTNCKHIQAVGMDTGLSEIGVHDNDDDIYYTIRKIREVCRKRPKIDVESLLYCLCH